MITTESKSIGILTRPWWKASFRIWDYITQAAILPLIMSLVVIMFVFLLQFLMRFIDKIVGKGLGLWTIFQLIVFNLSWMVVLAVPMAVLVACVMAFGALAASNELTAMKAAGVSLGRMIFPIMVLGTLIAIFDLQFNNLVLPDANHKAKDLMSDIQRKKPTLIVQPGQFTGDEEIPGYSILARKAIPNTSDLEQVTIYDHSQPNEGRILTAQHARLAFTKDFRNVILTLRDGEIHQVEAMVPTDYRRGRFNTYVVQVPTSGFDFMRQGESERSDRELSANDLLKYVHNREALRARQITMLKGHMNTFAKALTAEAPATPAQAPVVPPAQMPVTGLSPTALMPPPGSVTPSTVPQPYNRISFPAQLATVQNDLGMIQQTQGDIDTYMVEVHKKYAIPAACIIFALIGVPLGALAKKSGVGAGVGLSIGFFVLYWIFLIGGEKLADRQVITPFWGMWGGNLFLFLIGAYLTWRVAREAPPAKLTIWTRAKFGKLRKQKPETAVV